MKKINPSLLSFGNDAVRLERGPDFPSKDAPISWMLYKREDVTDDPDTTYTYRFAEVDRFAEEEAGKAPDAAIKAAEALAKE